ncbi:MAG: membrane-bound O-acyltransferase family protein [Thermoplasmata archaeon M8B2D]|nr:MAG: membrane-bound O-acyltransferase family protein [Thermoplasmata archaeon M8B2D]
MLFNSIDFAIFLPLVFIIYWFVVNKDLALQNLMILIASYVFYGWWDWRFLSLIFISSITDYSIGLGLNKSKSINKRKLLLSISLTINLGLLGFFKYFNFFIDSFIDFSSTFGFSFDSRSLNIILPVGISFYTFQTLSYTIDVYRDKIEPTKDIIAFFAFVSFFPQLVAGPIERAANLLPQFKEKRFFEYDKAADGLRQILWGLFKKVVIADSCAKNVDFIFANYNTLSGSILFLGTIYFAFQIYGDFSGYSDIAIGTAKLFGFDLMRNFAYPYFSRDIAEFWRRWHISLSTWFRDYVYIPLGGSYVNKLKHIRNIIITFTVSGFWHGANWTFITWGFINGLYYIPIMLLNKQKIHTGIVAQHNFFPSIKETCQILTTFFFTLIAWVFFRAETIQHAFSYLTHMFSTSLFVFPEDQKRHITLIIILLIIEWFHRKKEHAFQIDNYATFIRWPLYCILVLVILNYFGEEKTFIYFQF